MKYLIPDVQGTHYLPLVKDSLFWQTEDPQYLSPVSERLGLDRVKAVLDDGELQKGTLLDIGCNTGLMTFMAQNRGHRSTGVDNDIHQKVLGFTPVSSIDTARNLCSIYGLQPEFIKGDYVGLINQQRCWDYILYLSVWHHHLFGYGRSAFQRMSVSEAEDVLRRVWEVAKVALYFEIDGFLDEVLAAGWGQSRIAANLERVTGCRPTAIHVSPDGWAHPRTLWRLEKTAVPRREECREIPLGKSRRRNIGYAKAGVLRMSREANDWKGDEHPYGLDIRRQDILREGTILRLLKQHTHEGVMRILDFDDEWLSVEYIDGYLYDNKDGWLPDHLRNQASWLDLFGRGDIPEQIADAVRFLHKIGVAHTDIIPANIMVTKAGRAKLIDLLSCVPLTAETEQLDNDLLRRLYEYQGVEASEREENRRRWEESLTEVEREIEALPEGEKVAIADEEQIRPALKVARVTAPFPHRGGEYWGPPQNDEAAVSEVEKIRKEAFTYLVFAWPALWWLDYYKEFHSYLRSNFHCVLENGRLVVFDLRTTISPAATDE